MGTNRGTAAGVRRKNVYRMERTACTAVVRAYLVCMTDRFRPDLVKRFDLCNPNYSTMWLFGISLTLKYRRIITEEEGCGRRNSDQN